MLISSPGRAGGWVRSTSMTVRVAAQDVAHLLLSLLSVGDPDVDRCARVISGVGAGTVRTEPDSAGQGAGRSILVLAVASSV